MALGWGQLAGFAGKVLDRLTDPKARIDRELESLKKERDSILGKPKAPALEQRLSDITNRIIELRDKRDKISS